MPNSNLVQLVKQIAMEAVAASKPCDYRIGTVTSVNPLKIKVSQNIILDKDFLCFTQTASKTSLQRGNRVLMLRKAGGNEYMVIDKVVN